MGQLTSQQIFIIIVNVLYPGTLKGVPRQINPCSGLQTLQVR